jgi:hypothetical protein
MKTEEVKELEIVAPEGYEIDRTLSTIDKIVFKKKVDRWRDKAGLKVSGYFIDEENNFSALRDFPYSESSYDIFATKAQAKSALAMARISQIMVNDKRFGGVVTDEEWQDETIPKFIITRVKNHIFKDEFCRTYHFLAFHSHKQRDLFIEENEDLLKDYLMID